MRFMMMVRTVETGAPPSPTLQAAIGQLMAEMTRAGVLLEAGGLAASAKGARLTMSRSKLTVTDGPFTESKEIVGGFAILKAESRDEAIELGKRFLQAHDIPGESQEVTLEIRQIADGARPQGR